MRVQLKGTEIRTIKNVLFFFSIWAISDNVKIASTVVGAGGGCVGGWSGEVIVSEQPEAARGKAPRGQTARHIHTSVHTVHSYIVYFVNVSEIKASIVQSIFNHLSQLSYGHCQVGRTSSGTCRNQSGGVGGGGVL